MAQNLVGQSRLLHLLLRLVGHLLLRSARRLPDAMVMALTILLSPVLAPPPMGLLESLLPLAQVCWPLPLPAKAVLLIFQALVFYLV